jgi:hypothetical protein
MLSLIYIQIYGISETEFSLRVQVEPTQWGQSIKVVPVSVVAHIYRVFHDFRA